MQGAHKTVIYVYENIGQSCMQSRFSTTIVMYYQVITSRSYIYCVATHDNILEQWSRGPTHEWLHVSRSCVDPVISRADEDILLYGHGLSWFLQIGFTWRIHIGASRRGSWKSFCIFYLRELLALGWQASKDMNEYSYIQ